MALRARVVLAYAGMDHLSNQVVAAGLGAEISHRVDAHLSTTIAPPRRNSDQVGKRWLIRHGCFHVKYTARYSRLDQPDMRLPTFPCLRLAA